MTIRLSVYLPDELLYEGDVVKVNADGIDGMRGFLPRHVDFVLPLKTSMMTCTTADGKALFFAVHGGVLVKKGPAIMVSTAEGVMATSMEALPEGILQTFAEDDEQERVSRTAMAQLETVLVRELIELNR